MVPMSQTLLKAIFEVQRQNLILAKLNPQTSKHIDDALAFAYHKRLCPTLHTSSAADDPFNDAWKITRDFVDQVSTYCEEQRRRKEPVGFGTELEGKFSRDQRHTLVDVMRYIFLAGRFDPPFWKALLRMAPSEARGITHRFELNELLL